MWSESLLSPARGIQSAAKATLANMRRKINKTARDRGNTDRSGENKVPPEFTDELIHQVRISAKGTAKTWRLTIDRVELRTSYLFRLDQRNNQSSCEFTEVDFTPLPKGRKTRMDTHACLDLLLIGLPVTADPALLSKTGTIQKDCAVGLRYSYEAKRKLK